ncbi:MAG: flavodoxin domain-containing protein [Desulfopila sp.]|jgi:flavorubredoxin|nr:flavodoxin domain-containing protein [Desulfopila sp.]
MSKMVKALIVYASRTGETRKIAELIAEGLRFALVDVTIKDVKEITKVEALAGFDAYLFGSPTYHGEMMKSMKSFLFLAEQAELGGKTGGAFGSYGWSGEAAERIYDTMKNIYGMDLPNPPLMARSSSVDGGMKASQDYGREIAARITG